MLGTGSQRASSQTQQAILESSGSLRRCLLAGNVDSVSSITDGISQAARNSICYGHPSQSRQVDSTDLSSLTVKINKRLQKLCRVQTLHLHEKTNDIVLDFLKQVEQLRDLRYAHPTRIVTTGKVGSVVNHSRSQAVIRTFGSPATRRITIPFRTQTCSICHFQDNGCICTASRKPSCCTCKYTAVVSSRECPSSF